MNTPTPETSLYDSGASNVDILESVGNAVVDQHSSPAPDNSDSAGVESTGTPGASGVGVDGAGEVQPDWMLEAPDTLKAILAHQNLSAEHKKFLTETYGELHGFKSSPIGSSETIQEVSELFPGGMDDIREAHTQASQFRTEMEQYNSGDPAQQTELLSGLLQQSPDAFVSMLQAGTGLLKQTLRDDYTAFASDVTREHLDSVTDGKFSGFFDTVSQLNKDYQAAMDSGNADAANKLAGKLAGAALQVADWWGSAKNKIGYGEKAAPSPNGRVIAGRATEESAGPEFNYAIKEANLWKTNYSMRHDQMAAPLISSVLARDLAARKMELPQLWQQKVSTSVSDRVKSALDGDKQLRALYERVYLRNSPKDPRKWDKSDQAMRTILNHVKPKAERLAAKFMRETLDELSSLNKGAAPTARAATAGAGTRSSATGPSVNAGGGQKANFEDSIKAGKSNAEALQDMLGI